MTSAIIVAAGGGTRMNGKIRKQYFSIKGRSVVGHTLLVFDRCKSIATIILVIPEADVEYCQKQILLPLGLKKEVRLIHGGKERQDSVYNGLLAVDHKDGVVVIHDGVRPNIHHDDITACINGAVDHGACILGVPAYDTLKRVSDGGVIEETIKRDPIWLAQTPQAFQYELILKAHNRARMDGFSGTDDSVLVERLGEKVKIIKGSRYNVKITKEEDLVFAEAILFHRPLAPLVRDTEHAESDS